MSELQESFLPPEQGPSFLGTLDFHLHIVQGSLIAKLSKPIHPAFPVKEEVRWGIYSSTEEPTQATYNKKSYLSFIQMNRQPEITRNFRKNCASV